MAWSTKPIPDTLQTANDITLYPVFGSTIEEAKSICKKYKLYYKQHSYASGGVRMKRLYTEKEDFGAFLEELRRKTVEQ